MTPLDHAERAALGALVAEPRWCGQVLPWLHEQDFLHPRHRAVHRLLARLAANDETPTTDAVALAARDDPDARRNHADAPFLFDLIAACPYPDRAPVYARMVLEASLHRSVAEASTGLYAAAAEPGPSDDLDRALALQLDSWDLLWAELETRWAATSPPPTDAQMPVAPPAVARHADDDAPASEISLVSAVLAAPGTVHQVARLVCPEDLTHPGLAAAYRAVLDLGRQGTPVDHVTVAWELQRRRELTHGVTADTLQAMAGSAIPSLAVVHARDVLTDHLRRTSTEAAASIQRHAARTDIDPRQLATIGREDLRRLQNARARWRASLQQRATP